MNLVYGTPVEYTRARHAVVKVKRDDRANGRDVKAPALGKLRGMATLISSTDAKIIGAVDRRPTSRNSWAFAYLCKEMGRRCVAYASEVGAYQKWAVALGAEFKLFPGLELEELYLAAQLDFGNYEGGFMPPDDCHASALVEDAEEEVLRTGYGALECDDLVVPTGSGGLALGVLRGYLRLGLRPRVYLHLGGSRRTVDYILGLTDGAGLRRQFPSIEVVRETPACTTGLKQPSFPCNPTYEVPAWYWMVENLCSENRTILFWNAGA
jgi:hypothetical protein